MSFQTSLHACKRAEGKLGVALCCWVNHSQLSDLSCSSQARLYHWRGSCSAVGGLGWAPLQRSTSSVSFPLQLIPRFPHGGHWLLLSPSPTPRVSLSRSGNEGDRALPVIKGPSYILQAFAPLCLTASTIPDPSLFHLSHSKPIHQALTRAGSEFDFLAGTRKGWTALGLQERAGIF